MATTKLSLVDLRCDEADCIGDRCRYEVCPCRCHRYIHAAILNEGPNVSRKRDLIAPFLARCLMAATWVVAGLVCAVAFIISGLVILGWTCVAGGAYGGWCVLAKRNDLQ